MPSPMTRRMQAEIAVEDLIAEQDAEDARHRSERFTGVALDRTVNEYAAWDDGGFIGYRETPAAARRLISGLD